MKQFFIKKGHNILIEGKPKQNLISLEAPSTISFHPSKIRNLKIKLLIKKDDLVKIGSPLFFDKKK